MAVIYLRVPDEVVEYLKVEAHSKRMSVNRYIGESLCRRFNIPYPRRQSRRKVSLEQMEEIVKRRKDGESWSKIASLIGVHASTVRRRHLDSLLTTLQREKELSTDV